MKTEAFLDIFCAAVLCWPECAAPEGDKAPAGSQDARHSGEAEVEGSSLARQELAEGTEP